VAVLLSFFLRDLGTPLDIVGGDKTHHHIKGGRDDHYCTTVAQCPAAIAAPGPQDPRGGGAHPGADHSARRRGQGHNADRRRGVLPPLGRAQGRPPVCHGGRGRVAGPPGRQRVPQGQRRTAGGARRMRARLARRLRVGAADLDPRVAGPPTGARDPGAGEREHSGADAGRLGRALGHGAAHRGARGRRARRAGGYGRSSACWRGCRRGKKRSTKTKWTSTSTRALAGTGCCPGNRRRC